MYKPHSFVKVVFALFISLFVFACAEQSNEPRTLDDVLADQDDWLQERYAARKPKETLEFFGIKPGMTVVEALPGGGWYSRILLPYLGKEGQLIGADYSAEMYPLFGFFSDEQLEAKKTWPETWPEEADEWRDRNSASIAAFQFGSLPESMAGTADAVILIRAMHNLARFESQGGYLSQMLADIHAVLKDGGIVGIVQHRAPDAAADDWANGARGYLKQSFVTQKMTEAGFELVATSDINLNPKDNPGAEDVVWRLPPSLVTSRENEELKKQYQEIGESSRMTLLFKKVAKAN